ncbi:hypothetical protein EIP91_010718 [Steccherinum ochraceum]|uniref:SET domain-containing protein n=1 Tax=Steccherinum ochraceum TaxID=92696 RepID=A0A4R0R854_9APHY|nr:hypothetical protein EIP91_010718 [Steccherinum ochraceum]
MMATLLLGGLPPETVPSPMMTLNTDGPVRQESHIGRATTEEMHLGERSLPPERARQIRKSVLLAQIEAQRSSAVTVASSLLRTRQTFVGENTCYYSSTGLHELIQINMSSLSTGRRHKGAYLLCRVVSRTAHLVGINFVVEDSEGDCCHVTVHHYPHTLDFSSVETDMVFPIGSILAIREPFCKTSTTGSFCTIRVDAPSDVVFLKPNVPFLEGISWRSEIITPAPPSNAGEWKNLGVSSFKQQRWLCAAVAFSKGLELEPMNSLLLLNRSETYLRLLWYNSALRDAEIVLGMKLKDPILQRKALVRATRAHYYSGRYTDVTRLAHEHPLISDLTAYATKAAQRMREQTLGSYDWQVIHEVEENPGSRVDIAPYKGPVEVKTPDGGRRLRGLFVTQDVKAGELLLVSKAIASCYYSEVAVSHSQDSFEIRDLADQVVQRSWDDSNVACVIATLYAGDYFHSASYPPPPAPHLPASPTQSSANIDTARIEAVCAKNSFGVEKTPMRIAGAVLHELPSFCNHACLPTADFYILGDVMIVRARIAMKAGDEVTLAYIDPLKTGRSAELTKRDWDFICGCELCQADRADPPAARRQRRELLVLPAPRHLVDAAVRAELLHATYHDTPERRRCRAKPGLVRVYETLARLHRDAIDAPCDIAHLVPSIAFLMKSLEAAGTVIIDQRIIEVVSNEDVGELDLELPIDLAAPPRFPNECAQNMILLANSLFIMLQKKRALSWVKAATLVAIPVTGNDGALFVEIYKSLFLNELLDAFTSISAGFMS